MKKYNIPFILGIAVVILGVVFVGLFLIDLGINSKYFIKRDFNKAFQYRTTGDCSSFVNYVYRDQQKWIDRCEEEKTSNKEPVRNFEIQRISNKLFSDRAFLQVELTRNVDQKEDYTYSVSYEMRKDGLTWKIDQQIK